MASVWTDPYGLRHFVARLYDERGPGLLVTWCNDGQVVPAGEHAEWDPQARATCIICFVGPKSVDS